MRTVRPLRWLRRLGIVVAIALGLEAAATITQVDGTIVPTTNDLQTQDDVGTATDYGQGLDFTPDGLPNTDGNALDAWLDAAQVPQVFRPNTAQPVVFTDLLEQAGYENSFGYYNVGDDVFTPAGRARNLHPILGCGTPMVAGVDTEDPRFMSDATLLSAAHNTHHHGNPAAYYQNAEHGNSVSVDFAVEAAEGRYKNSFIGFYLITPEGYSTGNNCGDYAGTNFTFAYNYFTQPDLNNDGDFVHHLVYTSRRVPDRFYFTFEDLFRGGDNDFTDMLIQVEGLAPPCVVQAEICDGLDNDCDGIIDELDPDLVGVGDPCTCNGVGMTCDAVNCVGGVNCQGECLNGTTVCSGGAIECLSGLQNPEACDTLDNDCDGTIDEDVPGTGALCDGSDGDLCQEGTLVCNGSSIVCSDVSGTSVEVCNGLDDDCNGTADDSPTDGNLGLPCDSAVDTDLCNGGVYQCLGGAVVCSDDDASIAEVCNGADDDCDGTDDDSPVDVGVACSVGIGECETIGVTVCTGGVPTCNAVAGSPVAESCNGLDDDCDGDTDEQPSGDPLTQGCYTGAPATQGVGLCADGVQECLSGSFSGPCTGQVLPDTEVCDGLDNDCSGTPDDNIAGTGAGFPCDGPDGDLCQEGTMECNGVAVVCNDATGTIQELCNGLDDDCDGSFDEDPTDPTLDQPCDNAADTDLCLDGVIQCTGGGLTCSDDATSIVEICNGVDDDCDGTPDNNPTDVGVACSAGIGECEATGVTICSGGAPLCDAVPGGPVAETCNGLDDDCDGDTDEQPSGDPLDQVCYTGPLVTRGVGLCADGLQLCVAGSYSGPCSGQVLPDTELCDGLDNDCSGTPDDNIAGTGPGFPCDGPDGDDCEEGTLECNGVSIVCNDTTATNLEVCNGLDDDCDGTADDSPTDPTLGQPCDSTVDTDQCLDGVIQCVGGLVCSDDDASIVEVCNGLDDDCNGVADDATTDVGVACTVGVGECTRDGVTICSGGGPVCNAVAGPPGAETCNGLDDDCDGDVDEQASGDPLTQVCYTGPLATRGVGLCTDGYQQCLSGSFSGPCNDQVLPTGELCNGLNDDCDADTDEGIPGTGPSFPCDGPDGDLCEEGNLVCNGVAIVCGDTTGTIQELCNGLDDDCNGLTDDGVTDPTLGDPCDSLIDTDECPDGTIVCTASGLACDDDALSIVELCNGLDDDCDTVVDDNPTDVGDSCSAGIGACQRSGFTICSGGVPTCNAVPGTPGTELCNGLDDDCDTIIDNGFNVGATCDGVGECGPGLYECAPGGLTTICSTDVGGSEDESMEEICNGLDDDCDGDIDEGLTNMGPCGTDEGTCTIGVATCIAGVEVCVGSIGPVPEICDGLDNDCNTFVDDDPVDVGLPCGETNVGECDYGVTECAPGVPPDPPSIVCVGEVGPGEEICDALDNDCDGLIDAVDPDLVGVGDPCGATDVGECDFGEVVCIVGVTMCSGEIGPVAEICDGLDNDCNTFVDDDPIDIGTPCGVSTGVCTPGLWECWPAPDLRTCVGAGGGTDEICDGLDNDCNGLIDDGDLPGVDEPCGEEEGACEPGLFKCISGSLQCVGGVMPTTEICNGIDDDCDGIIDDGELCTGGVCLDGLCSVPCGAEEFLCPVDQMCVDGYCIPNPCWDVTCPDDAEGNMNICVDGDCMPVCDTVTCPVTLVCRPSDGLCVPETCYYLPSMCEDNQVCIDQECVTDLCYDITCGTDQFCREGNCIDTCAGVDCPVGQLCKDGVCQETGCAEDCSATEYCNPISGRCEHNPCLSILCDVGQICEPTTSECIPDICTGITCPDDQVCYDGNCYASNLPDAGVKDYVYAGGGGGCAVGGNPGAGRSWLLLLGLVGLIGARRRRREVGRRVALLAIGLVALVVLLGSCNVDPYCLNCTQGADGDGGGTGGDGNTGVPDARVITGCDAGVVGAEICDGEDNDCDGLIDEDFNLDGDPLNCGACGVTCLKTGTSAQCDEGQCEILNCLPGHIDHNGDITGPFEDSDGCEYACFVSNDGVEACDGLDNDCDTDVDEDTDFEGDETNCGECGRVCGAFMANVTCDEGDCVYDPATDCLDGFHDINLSPADGCEYQCDATGADVCDYRDNDCNGVVDDGYLLADDPANCGQCGRVCSFFQAYPSCAAGVCFFDPVTDCVDGYVDANGNQYDGCEYPCVKTNGGVEICDLVDNDCNAVVDDSPLGVGGSCNNAPGGVAEGLCTETGTETCVVGEIKCVGAPEPEVELCDDEDNDCDGVVDNDPADAGGLCLSPVGMCSPGIMVCNAGGSLDCEQEIGPTDELCNGLDDDCDGDTDEDEDLSDVGLGLPCGSDLGTCELGILICDHDLEKLVCDGAVGPVPETCNNQNDDCDLETDEGLTNLGACGSSQGNCVQGTLVCGAGGIEECTNALGPEPETCDGHDEDCDGDTDEDDLGAPLTTACYTGSAGTEGHGVCVGGNRTCVGGAFGACAGQVTDHLESCNGLDDDCDDLTDENPAGFPLSRACYTGDPTTRRVGQCADGYQQCLGGDYAGNPCVDEVLPAAAESCDNVDNDCNGSVDDNVPGTGVACDGADLDLCEEGTWECNGVAVVCNDNTGTIVELCNGLDDDCDGTPDDNPTDPILGQPCDGAGDTDLCLDGHRICSGGAIICDDTGPDRVELCNGGDDDCNGLIDDSPTDVGAACSVGIGACQSAGVIECSGGTPTCNAVAGTPGVESCNGIDDDCDGDVDENGLGNPLTQSCYTGDPLTRGVGACSDGLVECIGGTYVGNPCVGETTPAPSELCNSTDDDCNGSVDDNVPGTGGGCDGTDGDLCEEGTFICNGSAIICTDNTGTIVEVCNGLDDDCDGTPDDSPTDPSLGKPCDGLGDSDLCKEGVNICSGGSIICSDLTGDDVELCNGLDDDCNGAIDDSPTDVGVACTAGVGECESSGVTVCVTSAPVCNAVAGTPSLEVCNGLDDDCDTFIDEKPSGDPLTSSCYTGDPLTRGVGACSDGLVECLGGTYTGNPCVGETTPAPGELCNGADDDCNGSVDDNVPGTGGGCDGADSDLCEEGTWICNGSAVICTDNTGNIVEVCNGLDDDCNGTPDDSPTDASLGQACDGADSDQCKEGVNICSGGGIICDDLTGDDVELCNLVDDDCNGAIDDSPTDVGVPCTSGVGECAASGVTVCSMLGLPQCNAAAGSPILEVCNGLDDDCDGDTDEQPSGDPLTASCYTGDPLTRSVGLCTDGYQECLGGTFSGTCHDEVLPDTEVCDDDDNDCDGLLNEDGAGDPLTQSCYTGLPASTEDDGTCVGGSQTCIYGAYGACVGEVIPTSYDLCGDGLDTDCDTLDDAGEGCFTLGSEIRLDAPGGSAGTNAGEDHSFDVDIARSGNNVYAVWSDNVGGGYTDVLYRRSTNGGASWDDIINLTRSTEVGAPRTTNFGSWQSGDDETAAGSGRWYCNASMPVTRDGILTNWQLYIDNGGGAGDVAQLAVIRCTGGGGGAAGPVLSGCTRVALGPIHTINSSGLWTFDLGAGIAVQAGDYICADSNDYDIGVDCNGAAATGGCAGPDYNTQLLANLDTVGQPFTLNDSSSDGTLMIRAFGRPAVKPQIVAADSGLGFDRVYISYQKVDHNDVRQIRVLRSGDSGASFALPSSGGRLDTGGNDSFHHHLVTNSDGSRVAIAWEELDIGNLDRDVLIRRSTDAGDNFSAQQLVNVDSGTSPIAGRPQAAITGTGRFVVVWREARLGNTFDIYTNWSDSASAAFVVGNERRLDSDTAAPNDNRNSDYPQLVAAGSSLYVVWEDISTLLGGGSDTVFSRSTNNGATWSATDQILDDPVMEVSNSFSPRIAVDPRTAVATDDRIYVAWIDDRQGTQVYAIRSLDGGASFASPKRATSNAGAPITGETQFPRLAWAGGDTLVVAYVNGLPGQPRHVYATSSIDAGQTWQVTHDRLDTDIGQALTPAITGVSGGGLTSGAAVTWIDFRSGTQIHGDPYVRRVGH